jgi:hypothetical protein
VLGALSSTIGVDSETLRLVADFLIQLEKEHETNYGKNKPTLFK